MTDPDPPGSTSSESGSGAGSGSGLRGPRGCAEWTVVILGIIWVVLAIVFIFALVLRLSS